MNKKTLPKIGIIICAYSQEKLLLECIESIQKKTQYKNYKIFLVDDSGKGNLGKKVKKKFKGVDVTIKPKNTGFSSSNNLGIKKALDNYKADYILLLNDDCKIIEEDWLDKWINFAELDNSFGIFGTKVIHPDESLQWTAKNNRVRFFKQPGKIFELEGSEKNQEVSNVIGCCFLIKKRVLEKVGFLDEKFDPIYGEESDLCLRAKKAGFKIGYYGNTKIIHYGAATSSAIESDFIWFIKKRHGIRLEWLNHNIFVIIKFTFAHFASAIFDKKPFRKLDLLFKAYKENFKNFKEIISKRKERNNY